MMAVSAATLPAGAEWSYEVKWDGYRAQAVKHGASVSLASRNLKNITRQFPEVVRAAASVHATIRRPRRRDRRARRGRPPVVSGAAPRRDRGAVGRLLRLRSAASQRPRPDRRRRWTTGARRCARSSTGPASCCRIRCRGRPTRSPPPSAASVWKGWSRSGAGRPTPPAGGATPGSRSDIAKHQELVIGGFKPNAGNFDSLVVGYYEGQGSAVRRQGAQRLHAASSRTGVRKHSRLADGRAARSRTCRRPGRDAGVKGSPLTRCGRCAG